LSQSGRFNTSRGVLPSGGPMMLSRCITSRMRQIKHVAFARQVFRAHAVEYRPRIHARGYHAFLTKAASGVTAARLVTFGRLEIDGWAIRETVF
jgi:hypothetical protein